MRYTPAKGRALPRACVWPALLLTSACTEHVSSEETRVWGDSGSLGRIGMFMNDVVGCLLATYFHSV